MDTLWERGGRMKTLRLPHLGHGVKMSAAFICMFTEATMSIHDRHLRIPSAERPLKVSKMLPAIVNDIP